MPANTYTLIEKIVVGAAGASSITFTSIPQTYTDLVVKISGRTEYSPATWDWAVCSFNGTSTTTNWSRLQLFGNGASAGSSGGAGSNEVAWLNSNNSTASTFGNAEFYIPNYAGSNNKSISADSVTENNATSALAIFNATLWSNTAAITSITLTTGSNPSNKFMQYTTAYLYGIAKEGVTPSPSSAPYATGGDRIVFDGTYWYHVFTSTGTFTPQKGLTADCLVIAGGGAGSGGWGAGGGAGGVQYTSSVSFASATNYTATIGAGASYAAQSTVQGSNSNITGGSLSLTAAVGGGGAGSRSGSQQAGGNGGSGGGAVGNYGASTNAGGTATSGQGNNGGSASNSASGMAGGGGAGAAGGNASGGNQGNGGVGTSSYSSWGSATSTGQLSSGTYYYAGGGGGGGSTGVPTPGTGGLGGGGAGGTGGGTFSDGVAGTANTGGGGGGGNQASSGRDGYGGNGGSGIVIIRYAA